MKFYAVRIPIRVIFTHWPDCAAVVNNARFSKYKSFPTIEQARAFMEEGVGHLNEKRLGNLNDASASGASGASSGSGAATGGRGGGGGGGGGGGKNRKRTWEDIEEEYEGLCGKDGLLVDGDDYEEEEDEEYDEEDDDEGKEEEQEEEYIDSVKSG